MYSEVFIWVTGASLACFLSYSSAFHLTQPSSVRLSSTNLHLSSSSSISSSISSSQNTKEIADSDKKIRYRGRVAYNGSTFKGWQVQAKGRTVQGEIEQMLSRRFDRQVKIVGAGRTDSGVHARGQAFHFDVYPEEAITNNKSDVNEVLQHDEEQFCKKLQTSLNRMLPQDIRVWNIQQCPPPVQVIKTISSLSDGDDKESSSIRIYKWHVIYNAKQKLYVYRINIGPQTISTDPIERYTRVYVDGDIDVSYLQRILSYYEGTHDFRAFAGAIEANQRKDGVEHKNTVRTVHSIKLIDEGEGKYRIEILLKGALYKMVRNMVGTALDVCRGRLSEEYMLQMLHHSDENNENRQFVRKDNKCKPAPPEGLTLEWVYFDDDF